jgi:hypothetical protein
VIVSRSSVCFEVAVDGQTIEKLKGVVLWLDLVTGDTFDMGTAERAILRSDGLAMDVAGSFGTYSILLKRVGHMKFAGSWTCRTPKGEEKGHADCTLEAEGDYLRLAGEWDCGKCDWFARLEKVAGF